MVPLRVHLGHAVRELRRAAGFSQEEFAAHTDVHRTSMSSIELGKLNVRLDTLVQIANGLEMPAWELLRIAEVGAESGGPPRAGGGGPHEAPYSREATKSPSDATVRRKVAEDRRR